MRSGASGTRVNAGWFKAQGMWSQNLSPTPGAASMNLIAPDAALQLPYRKDLHKEPLQLRAATLWG
jgi:hypothetical protein